ncbi:hypothetical protein ASR50_03470 [Streptomyces sp. 4F]|nr:hypothetical protein ASR50_03470 [Streptomyces sp. 4F]
MTRALAGAPGPVLAVSGWMRQVPDQIGQWVEHDYASLGTDGFGLSDTREAVRRHFGVDPASIAVAALDRPARTGAVPPEAVAEAVPGTDGRADPGAGRARRSPSGRGPWTRPAPGRAGRRRLVAW